MNYCSMDCVIINIQYELSNLILECDDKSKIITYLRQASKLIEKAKDECRHNIAELSAKNNNGGVAE